MTHTTRRRPPSTWPSLIVALAAFAGGCLDDPDAILDEDLGEVDSELICNSENWNDIGTWDDDPARRVAAQYGVAVANIGNCTGELYNDRYLVTAHHCGQYTRTAKFGTFSYGSSYAYGRAQDLGIPSASSLPLDTLTDFTCRYWTTFYNSGGGKRDIDVYRCDPKNIAGYGNLYPGDVWGHFEMANASLPDDTQIAAISYNKASFYSAKRVLLGPGKIIDRYDNCSSESGDPEHCFEHDADTKGGSSGGAIVRLSDNRLAGLVQGAWDSPFGSGCPFPDGNYGTYNATVSSYPEPGTSYNTLPLSAQTTTSAWAGGYGGTWRNLTCPGGYMAVGVIGTTYTGYPYGDNPVGNFGLVCSPFKTYTGVSDRQVHAWKVIVGGSYDTGFAIGTYDFNPYTHEVLALQREGGQPAYNMLWQRQSLTLCRPGYYLTGVETRDGNYLHQVKAIECTRHDKRASVRHDLRKQMGSRPGTTQWLRCPDTVLGETSNPNRAAFGLYIRSGWFTDGVALRCRTF